MIKILYRQTTRPYHQQLCWKCKAMLAYEDNDIQKKVTYTSPIGCYTEYYIVCPRCETKIVHDYRDGAQ